MRNDAEVPDNLWLRFKVTVNLLYNKGFISVIDFL